MVDLFYSLHLRMYNKHGGSAALVIQQLLPEKLLQQPGQPAEYSALTRERTCEQLPLLLELIGSSGLRGSALSGQLESFLEQQAGIKAMKALQQALKFIFSIVPKSLAQPSRW